MDFKKIYEKFAGLNTYQERLNTDDYIELVFYNADLDKWTDVLTGFLDPPVKPAGEKPSKEYLQLTENNGGIMKGQTLYGKDFNDCLILAMLWPWSDGEHITLKIISKEK